MRFIKPFAGISNGARLVLLIFLVFFGAMLSVALAYLAMMAIDGKSAFTDTGMMDNIRFVRVMQIFNQIGIFIIPPVLLALLIEARPLEYLGFKKPAGIHILGTFLLIMSINPIIGWLMEVNEAMQLPESMQSIEQWMRNSENTANELVEWILSYTDASSMVINVFMVVLLPAVGEELLFRAVLIRLFNNIFKNIHIAVWVSAIIFSAFHFQFFGFLPRMFLGLFFGYIFIWSGSIWIPIIAHFINNGTVVLITFLNSKGLITESPQEFGTFESPLLLVSSIALTIMIGWLFYRTRNKPMPEELNARQ